MLVMRVLRFSLWRLLFFFLSLGLARGEAAVPSLIEAIKRSLFLKEAWTLHVSALIETSTDVPGSSAGTSIRRRARASGTAILKRKKPHKRQKGGTKKIKSVRLTSRGDEDDGTPKPIYTYTSVYRHVYLLHRQTYTRRGLSTRTCGREKKRLGNFRREKRRCPA